MKERRIARSGMCKKVVEVTKYVETMAEKIEGKTTHQLKGNRIKGSARTKNNSRYKLQHCDIKIEYVKKSNDLGIL